MERAQTQNVDGLEITVAVLDARESRAFFGVSWKTFWRPSGSSS
jgi:hypothetical protein